MANYEDGSTSGAHPGMSPDEAAKRLRAHEQPLGKQGPADEKSPLGWTEDTQGETQPGEQPHASGAPEQPHARLPVDATAEQPFAEPGPVPVTATPASSLTGVAADADGYRPSPDIADAALAAAFVAADLGSTALSVAELASVDGGASAPRALHAPGDSDTDSDGSAPLLASGDLTGNVIEDSEQQVSGHLSASGGERGVAAQWQAMAPDGVYGKLEVAPDGSWRYTPNSTSPAFQGLSEGQHVIEEFLVRGSSGNRAPVDLLIRIDLQGTNDGPAITQGSVLTGSNREDMQTSASGQLEAVDADLDARLHWQVDTVHGQYGELTLDAATGQWQYQLDNERATTQGLSEGEVASEYFLASVIDEYGASSTARLTITIVGLNDDPVIARIDALQATQDGGVIQGKITAADVDTLDHLSFSTTANVQGFILAADGSYRFDPSNAAYRYLAKGATQQLIIPVTVSDGHGGIATQNLLINLTGSNDLPVLDTLIARTATEGDAPWTGQLSATDVDDDHTLTYSTAAEVDGFTLNPDGSYRFDPGHSRYQSLPAGVQQTLVIPLTVTDEHGGSATQNLLIIVTGTNQGAVISGVVNGTVTEDNTSSGSHLLETGGQLTISDPDSGETRFSPHSGSDALAGKYGKLTLDATGAWHYAADTRQAVVQQLGQGETLTDHFTITSADGTQQSIDVTLTGTNDVPVIGYESIISGTISEDDTGNTLVGVLIANDVDTGSQLSWSLVAAEGTFGTLAIDPVSGQWTYTLDNSRPATQALAEGQQVTEHFTALVTDEHGAVAQQPIEISVRGTNDDPVLEQVPAQNLAEDDTVVLGQLVSTDVDSGDSLSYGTASTVAGFSLNADGSYRFNPGDAAYQHLAEGVQQVLTIPVTVTDSHGATATQNLVITLTGTNDLPVMSVLTAITAFEGDVAITGHVIATDVDTGDVLTYSTSANVDGFSINPDGTYHFDPSDAAYQCLIAGETQILNIPLTVTDTHGGTATQILTITLTGTNQGSIIAGVDTGGVTEDQITSGGLLLETDGQLSITDPDQSQSSFVVHSGAGVITGLYGVLTIDASGAWHYAADNHQAAVQQLGQGDTLIDHFTISSVDGTQHNIDITLSGTNDVPVISQSSIITGAITEDDTSNTIGGALIASDVDTGSQLSWSLVSAAGVYGAMSIDMTSGQWIYTLDNSRPATQGLAQGQQVSERFSVLVTDEHGASARQDVVISVRGTNDNPVLQNVPFLSVIEGGAVEYGQLNASDVDTGETLSFSTSAQVSGFTLSAEGAYSFDPANTAYQHLVAGATLTLNIPVSVTDSHGATSTQILTITLIGTNQGAMIAGVDTGSVTEDSVSPDTHLLEAGGQLTIRDPDSDQAVFIEHSGATALTGTYGSLTIDASGAWHYSADNNQAAVQQLGQGATLTEHFTITSVDGTPHTVTITLNGTNDVPVLNAISARNAVEDGVKVTGQLTATDIDTGDTLNYSATSIPAGLTLNANGSYSFNPGDAAYQHLAEGAQQVLTIPVTVTDSKGATAAQNLVITITGTNDLPVMSALTARTATEGGVAITGKAVATDIDTGDVLTYSTSATVDGFSIDPDGTYRFDPSNPAYRSLNAGAKQVLSIPLTVADNHGGTATKILTITLTGTNQGAVIAGVNSGSVTEDQSVAGKLETGGQLTISDLDKGEAGFTPRSATGALAGKFGSLTIDASGAWHYSAVNNQTAVQKLSEGATVTDTFTVLSVDGTAHQITITLLGTNDAPQIGGSSVVSGAVTEDAAVPSATGRLVASDVDTDAQLSWSLTSTAGSYGTLALDAASGIWTYSLDNSRAATQALAAGQKVHDSFIATVTDNHGATTQQTVDIVVTGTNDLPVISGSSTGAVTEDDPQSVVSGTLAHVDVDTGDTFSWSLVNGGGTYGTFTFDTSSGIWNYSLDNSRAATQALAVGEHHTESFTVRGVDASGTPVNQVISIEINGSNDNPAIGGAHQGSVVEDRNMIASGALSFSDIDTGDKLGVWQVLTPQGIYGSLSIDQSGHWTYHLDVARSQSIKAGDLPQDSFIVRVTDGHGGYADQQVTLQVTGTNDGPAIDPKSPALTGDVTEDQIGATIAQGTIASGDPDIGDTLTWSIDGYSAQSVGGYGTLTLDQNGHWTYTLDHDKADRLAKGTTVVDRFVVNVTDAAGERSSATIQVQVHGTNDGPHIGGTSSGVVTEDIATRVSGQLLPGDVDIGDSAIWTVVGDPHGQLGTLSLDAQGVWTYQLDTGSASVNALGEGASVTETFRVQVTDPHGMTDFKEVTLTVRGHNDAPIISGVDSADVAEDQTNSVTGLLCVEDVDSGDQARFEQSEYAGNYGQFLLNTDGQWTYQLFDSQSHVQALAQGQTATETFTIAAFDRNGGVTYRPVTITVHGTNDAPVISGVSTGVVFVYVSQTASGRLVGQDPDQLDTTTWSLIEGRGEFGTLALDDYGHWTYTLDVNDADTKALQPGEQRIDSFRVQLTDNHGASVECVVNVSVVGTQAPNAPPDPGTGEGGGTPPRSLPSVSVSVTEDVSIVRSGLLIGASPDGSPVTWQVTPVNGTFGILTLGPNGEWLYNLHNAAAQVQALNDGQSVQEYFNVSGVDASGNKVQTQFTVTINGTNDTPRIVGVDQGTTTEDQQLNASGSLAVQDLNTGDSATWSAQQGQGHLGVFSVDNKGDWTYRLDNDKAQYLNAGESVVERFQVNVTDSHGGTASHEVVVTVHGTADGPMIPSVMEGIAEPGANEVLTGKIPVFDSDIGDTFSFSLVSSAHGQAGTLSIQPDGSWHYQLDQATANTALKSLAAGQQLTDTFTVQVRDSNGHIALEQIRLVVSGTNDAPVINGATSGSVTDRSIIQSGGKLIASDPDAGDVVTVNPQAVDSAHGHFEVASDGSWFYTLNVLNPAVKALNAGDRLTETFHVTAVDGSGISVGKDVVITIYGSNDLPVVGGDVRGSTTEDTTPGTQGQLTTTDVDTGDTTQWTGMNTAGAYGRFEMSAKGTWSYLLNGSSAQVQALKDGQVVSETFTAHGRDQHGGEVTQVITIDVHGTNDVAIITGQRTGDLTEDQNVTAGQLVVSGQIRLTDIDTGEGILTAQTVQGAYGTLELRSDGTWRYSADNAQDAIQHLGQGATLTDHVNLTSADGTPYQISVTVHGTNDVPVLSALTAQNAVEEGAMVTGQLLGTDTDTGDTLIYSSTANVAGFTLNADGSYSFDPSDAAYKHLVGGAIQVLTIPMTVTDSQGATAAQSLIITLTGTNQGAVIAGVDTGSVTEDQSATGHLETGGQLTISDHDSGEAQFVAHNGTSTLLGNFGSLTITASGTWHYTADNNQIAIQQLGEGARINDHFTVSSVDGTQHQIIVTLIGTNDVPVFNAIAAQDAVEERAKVTGQLLSTDADTGDTLIYSSGSSVAGFTLNADGSYSFDPSDAAYRHLAEGATQLLTIPITVTDSQGATATQDLIITLTGTNQEAVIAGVDTGNVQKEGFTESSHLLETNGQLNVSDPDDNEASFVAHSGADALVGSYGLLDIDASGAWHYSADNNQVAVQQLAEGEQLAEYFTVSSVDGTTHNLTISLTGSYDEPSPGVMSVADVDDAAGMAGPLASLAVSSVGLYLQFARTETGHPAEGYEEQSDSASAEHAAAPVLPTIEEYLQLGGVDPAHLSHPDPMQSPDHQLPPDSPLHPGATAPEPAGSGYHDAGLADAPFMPITEAEPQHHG